MLVTVPNIPGLQPSIGGADGEQPLAPDHTEADLIGLFVGIEYRDADGDVSRRRVSVSSVAGEHLNCWCHEAGAPRCFRVDRITFFIDLDGIAYEPAEFFRLLCADTTGVNVEWGKRVAIGDCLRRPWRREIAVLAALSHSDGFMHPTEVEAIIQFVGKEAELEGVPYTDADLEALSQTVRRVKVTESAAIEHMETIARDCIRHPRRAAKLLRSILRVAGADGHLHPAEFRFAQMAERRLGSDPVTSVPSGH